MHLTDEQIGSLLAGEADEGAAAHAAACPACALELEDLKAALGHWRRGLDAELEVRPRSEAPRPARLPWLLLASAAAVVPFLLARPAAVPHAQPPVTTVAAAAEDDLLASIDAALERDLPSALEPASLLVADLSAAGVQHQ